MHVALIGAGALGRVFGAHLARAGERVSFVVRPARLADTSPVVIERQNGDRRRSEIVDPMRAEHVPADADAVLLTVRADQLDESVERLIRKAPAVPIVAFTPLLPLGLERVGAWAPGRCFVGMPTFAAEIDPVAGVTRYWSFRAAPTLLERDGRPGAPVVARLAEAFVRAGLPAKLSADVRARNPATTIAFFPISVAVSRSGGTEALLENPERLALAARASKETLALARLIGPIEAPVALAGRFLGPGSLRGALRLSRLVMPRAVEFLDTHFGTKLSGQHRVLGAEILELGKRRSLPLDGLAELLAAPDT